MRKYGLCYSRYVNIPHNRSAAKLVTTLQYPVENLSRSACVPLGEAFVLGQVIMPVLNIN